jgi:predicted  nucleic acid-binding Zn-ribbon protein
MMMNEQITLLAHLAVIDVRLDELHDELGDLPQEVKALELVVREKVLAVEGTQAKLNDLEHLRGTGHVSMQEMHDKEVKLAEQQFQVKNNREFDAITKEIDHIKGERSSLEDRMRTASVSEENLQATLERQNAELEVARIMLRDKEQELDSLTGDSNIELKKFIAMRLKVIAKVDDTLEAEYERIRTFHREAAVSIRRGSCSGCYSAIPSQRIMEMKHNRERMYTCENCGRILITEDVADIVEAAVEDGNV